MSELTIPPQDRTWIAKQLAKPEFVTWDRYITDKRNDSLLVEVYGWIDRPDNHKDFVICRFWPDREWFEYTTSSDEYTDELTRLWWGEEYVDGHNGCIRVEGTFDIPNMVEL